MSRTHSPERCLSELTGEKVDLVPMSALKPAHRRTILNEVVYREVLKLLQECGPRLSGVQSVPIRSITPGTGTSSHVHHCDYQYRVAT
jgi:hypothetical protein